LGTFLIAGDQFLDEDVIKAQRRTIHVAVAVRTFVHVGAAGADPAGAAFRAGAAMTFRSEAEQHIDAFVGALAVGNHAAVIQHADRAYGSAEGIVIRRSCHRQLFLHRVEEAAAEAVESGMVGQLQGFGRHAAGLNGAAGIVSGGTVGCARVAGAGADAVIGVGRGQGDIGRAGHVAVRLGEAHQRKLDVVHAALGAVDALAVHHRRQHGDAAAHQQRDDHQHNGHFDQRKGLARFFQFEPPHLGGQLSIRISGWQSWCGGAGSPEIE
jgi:hypothetical protein